jgi:hypothetical protein
MDARRVPGSGLCGAARFDIDGDIGIAPQAHFYFDDRASWTRVADELPRFGGTTGVEPHS